MDKRAFLARYAELERLWRSRQKTDSKIPVSFLIKSAAASGVVPAEVGEIMQKLQDRYAEIVRTGNDSSDQDEEDFQKLFSLIVPV